MPDLRLFNAQAALVAAKNGVRLNGKTYNLGDPLKDTTVNLRKRRQLFLHNKLTHPELLDKPTVQVQEEPSSEGSTSETETVVETEIVETPVEIETDSVEEAEEPVENWRKVNNKKSGKKDK